MYDVKKTILWGILLVALTPLAFVLMPLLAVLTGVGGLSMLIYQLFHLKQDEQNA